MAAAKKKEMLPAGWSVYERSSADGQEWIGEHSGAAGVDFQLRGATREQLVARIVSRDAYRAQMGVTV